ncbi:MAG: hypothetical protein ACTHNU_16305 [Gaiellales bacterium]
MTHRTPLLTLAGAALVTAVLAPAAAASVQPHVSSSPALTWQVPAPNWTHANKEAGRVDDVLRVGNRVYMGGNFGELANHAGVIRPRTYLAAVSARTGLLGAFHPRLNGRVYALAASPDGRYLYAGGDFTTVNGVPRNHLAAFRVSTRRLATRVPDMHISGPVLALAVTGTSIYVGGSFTSVAGHPRARLAKFSLARSGRFVLSAWAPKASGDVRDLVVDRARGRVIAGGLFTSVNGHAENRIAAIGARLGKVKPWATHPTADILDLATANGRLYAAEAGPGGTALAFNLATGQRLWYYKTDGNVQAVSTVRGYPVFGMHGDYVAAAKNRQMAEYGGSPRIQRHKLFMLSPAGALQAWNPSVTSTAGVLGVWALRGSHGSIYVGGDFTMVHGHPQQRFAVLRGR